MKVAYSLAVAVYATCLLASFHAAPVSQDAKTKESAPVPQQKANEDVKSKASVSVSQFKQQKNLEQQLASLSDSRSTDAAKPVTSQQQQQQTADDALMIDEQSEQLLEEIANLRPRAVAEYLLVTGNWEMLEDVLTDLVNSQLVTEEEAQAFYDDVSFEFEQAMLQVMAAEKSDNEEQEEEVVPAQAEEYAYGDSEVEEDGSDAAMASPFDSEDNSVDEEELNELLAHLMNEEQQAEDEKDSDAEAEKELEEVAAGSEQQQQLTAESELEELSKTASQQKVAQSPKSQGQPTSNN